MFTNIKRDFIFALTISAAILGYGFCGDAQAQTTQPVYVRPSKGAAITVSVTAGTPSVVLDVTAFEAVQIKAFGDTWNVDNLNQFVRFTYTAGVGVPKICTIFTQTSSDKTAGFATVQSENGEHRHNNVEAACPAVASVVVTPLPFSPHAAVSGSVENNGYVQTPYPVPVGGISPGSFGGQTVRAVVAETTASPASGGEGPVGIVTSTSVKRIGVRTSAGLPPGSPASVAASPAQASFVITGSQYYTHIQNVGTFPVACAVGSTFPTATNYSFILAAGTAAEDGKGGSKVLDYIYGQNIYCVGLGGASAVAYMIQGEGQ